MATKNYFTGNGATTQFDISVDYGDEPASVVATINGSVVTYTWVNSGRIELSTVPPVGSSVVIARVTDISEPDVSFANTAVLIAEDLNDAVGQVLNKLQEIDGDTSGVNARALQVPPGEVAATIPSAASRANKFLAFDGAGNAVVANGTGADAGLRADLAAASGAALVGGTGGSVQALITALQASVSALAAATGGQLLSVSKRTPRIATFVPPAGINNPLKLNLVYVGDKYDYSVDPHTANDWTVWTEGVVDRYVHTDTGSDAADGLTPATAWKSIDKVHADAPTKARIYLRGKRAGYLSWTLANFNAGTRLLKFIGEADKTVWNPTGRMWFTGWRETYNLAFMNWTADGGAWVSSAAVVHSTINSMLDARYCNAEGIPSPVVWVASAALCRATPGSFYTDGTNLWVNLRDGRKPDPADGWIVGASFSGWNCTSDGHVVFENIGWCYNAGAASAAACRHRPTTAFVENTHRVAYKDCIAVGSSGNGFEIFDMFCATKVNCHAGYCYYDAHSYTSFISTGINPLRAQFSTFYEKECTWVTTGFGWRTNPTASSSNNGSTSHAGMCGFRVECRGVGSQHSGFADVNGAYIMMGGCKGSRASGTGLFQNNYWYQKLAGEGKAGACCILIGCSGDGDTQGGTQYVFSSWNDSETAASLGEFLLFDWRGELSVNTRVGTILKNYLTGATL